MAISEPSELTVLKIVAQRLSEQGIAYMLTGSIAMNLYAIPRMTRDIDIVVELEPKDVDRVYTLFKNDFYIDGAMIKEAISSQGLFNIIHNEFLVKVDFIVRKDTEYRHLEFSRRRNVFIQDSSISVVAPEDLIISKLIWAKESRSQVQMEDVRNILKAVKDLDKRYLNHWIKTLNLEEAAKEIML